MFAGVWESVRKNHFAMMAVCCLLPVIAILALQFIGITDWWVYPLAAVLCVGSHALMMFFGGGKKCH